MDKLYLYIDYDPSEYTNYFHMAVNDNVVIRYYPEEKEDDMFKTILEKENAVNRFELYIVQSENASEWDYQKAFREHGMELGPMEGCEPGQLCRELNALFDEEYGIRGQDEPSDKKFIQLLYFGSCVLQQVGCELHETLRQAEEILKHGGEEMTELARIIRKKYDRMNAHE